jgi:site-specific DNA-methyltransferase (adenine-specific)
VLPFDKLWEAYKRVLKPTGTVILFGNQPFTSAVVQSNLKWFKQCLVWNKNKCGSPGLAKIRPMQTHEDIIVFAPKRTVYNPQMEAGEPYSRKSKNPEGYVGRVNNHGYGLKPRTEFSNEGTRYPKSILNIPMDVSAQQRIHPTQKPVALAEYLIRTYSNEGDVVLDNTAGSGFTALGAERCGRKWICIEKDEQHSADAIARIKSTQAQGFPV